MKLTTTDVEHVASLARLNLSAEQIKTFRGELASVLEYVGQLNEVDTTDIGPINQINRLVNITRNDTEIPSQQLSLKDGHFAVSRVI